MHNSSCRQQNVAAAVSSNEDLTIENFSTRIHMYVCVSVYDATCVCGRVHGIVRTDTFSRWKRETRPLSRPAHERGMTRDPVQGAEPSARVVTAQVRITK